MIQFLIIKFLLLGATLGSDAMQYLVSVIFPKENGHVVKWPCSTSKQITGQLNKQLCSKNKNVFPLCFVTLIPQFRKLLLKVLCPKTFINTARLVILSYCYFYNRLEKTHIIFLLPGHKQYGLKGPVRGLVTQHLKIVW